jgi:hypothetical protein
LGTGSQQQSATDKNTDDRRFLHHVLLQPIFLHQLGDFPLGSLDLGGGQVGF